VPASEPLATPSRVCGPRERLHAAGPAALSDAELVALLLRTGAAARDALEVARQLLERVGGLRALDRALASELAAVAGVGPAKAASVRAALELGRRVAAHRLDRGDEIRGPEDVYRHFYGALRDARQEHFLALLLDGRHRVLGEVLVSRGTLTASLVHPREVFRAAVREAAAAVVLVHNHPSGDPRASEEDRRVTRRLGRAGELIGIRVLDHVVVAEHGYFSFVEAGELDGGLDAPGGTGADGGAGTNAGEGRRQGGRRQGGRREGGRGGESRPGAARHTGRPRASDAAAGQRPSVPR